MSYETDFGVKTWTNPWTSEVITVPASKYVFCEMVPLDQFLFYDEFSPNTAALTFEFYDEIEENQVFFFDLFFETDENKNIGKIISINRPRVLSCA